MRGSISRSVLTKELFSSESTVKEVYVNPNFDWSDAVGQFYVLGSEGIPYSTLFNKLNEIWGYGNCKLSITKEFDALVLYGKRLVYNSGRWVGV